MAKHDKAYLTLRLRPDGNVRVEQKGTWSEATAMMTVALSNGYVSDLIATAQKVHRELQEAERVREI
jgi:hypothetical protein